MHDSCGGPKGEFPETLTDQIVKLTRHSFTAKAKTSYMNTLKSNLNLMEEVILEGDFEKNNPCVV